MKTTLWSAVLRSLGEVFDPLPPHRRDIHASLDQRLAAAMDKLGRQSR